MDHHHLSSCQTIGVGTGKSFFELFDKIFDYFKEKNVLTVLCNNLNAANFQASAVFKMDFPLKTL